MTRPDPLPVLHAAALAIRDATTPEAGFAALQDALAAVPGFRLFTVMAHDAARGWSHRVWSSWPELWPPGGGKPLAARDWAVQVVQRGEPWSGSGAAAMAWAYPDHALIRRQGLGSGLNLPVRARGVTLGVLNLLHTEDWYRPDDMPTGLVLAGLAVPLLTRMGA